MDNTVGTTKQLVNKLYKDGDGNPLVLTDTQEKIFDAIWKKKNPRCHIMCHTRFGKSFMVALAVLTRITHFPEKWAIVAPSEKKARIIMAEIIEHTFDNEYTKSKLDFDKGESLDRLRRERSKDRLTYKLADGKLGEVYIMSADSRNKAKAGDSVMGFGAPNVILDEAALIDDDIEAKIFRMLGDHMDNFYFKIGNPFRRNHFLTDCRDPAFHKINADWKVGWEEGRLNEKFLKEARKKPHFDILYKNKFPAEDAVDDAGFSSLITETEFDRALSKEEQMFGVKAMGVDIARGGGNYNVWVLRSKNYAKLLAKNRDPDLMSVVGTTIRLARENGVEMNNVSLDDIGVGGGVCDRLREEKHPVNPVKVSESTDDDIYSNKRAKNYWELKEWINKGGKLCSKNDWTELLKIKYKENSSGKLQIMSKEMMSRDGIPSPDVADALMLTFDRKAVDRKAQELRKTKEPFNPHDLI